MSKFATIPLVHDSQDHDTQTILDISGKSDANEISDQLGLRVTRAEEPGIGLQEFHGSRHAGGISLLQTPKILTETLRIRGKNRRMGKLTGLGMTCPGFLVSRSASADCRRLVQDLLSLASILGASRIVENAVLIDLHLEASQVAVDPVFLGVHPVHSTEKPAVPTSSAQPASRPTTWP